MSFRNFFNEPTKDERDKMDEVNEIVTPELAKGKIFHLNRERGWGFISSEEPTLKFRRIFFHWTTLVKDTLTFEKLEVNMEVEFNPVESDGGDSDKWKAFNVKVLEK